MQTSPSSRLVAEQEKSAFSQPSILVEVQLIAAALQCSSPQSIGHEARIRRQSLFRRWQSPMKKGQFSCSMLSSQVHLLQLRCVAPELEVDAVGVTISAKGRHAVGLCWADRLTPAASFGVSGSQSASFPPTLLCRSSPHSSRGADHGTLDVVVERSTPVLSAFHRPSTVLRLLC